jgi:S1-C subfamily serine protease
VVTVFARRRLPSSGIHWRNGVIVTVEHAIQRQEEITVLLPDGNRAQASVAGRDPATDLAVLKVDSGDNPVPSYGDSTKLKLANIVVALGRTRSGNLVASSGIIGGIAGASRTWRSGRLDQSIHLDLELYPGFSGGPLVDVEGEVLGVNTSGLSRGRPVCIPVATVNRVVDELLAKGYIARPYLGLAMQPVRIPEEVRSKLNLSAAVGLIVLHVEPDGPAGKAGIVLGDVIVELEGKSATDLYQIRSALAGSEIGATLKVKVLRGGALVEAAVKLSERPTK